MQISLLSGRGAANRGCAQLLNATADGRRSVQIADPHSLMSQRVADDASNPIRQCASWISIQGIKKIDFIGGVATILENLYDARPAAGMAHDNQPTELQTLRYPGDWLACQGEALQHVGYEPRRSPTGHSRKAVRPEGRRGGSFRAGIAARDDRDRWSPAIGQTLASLYGVETTDIDEVRKQSLALTIDSEAVEIEDDIQSSGAGIDCRP